MTDAVGEALTFIDLVTYPTQPDCVTVYVITVVPLDTPVTTPELFTVATPGVLLVHDPPPGELDNVIVFVSHTWSAPLIAETEGGDYTVILA